MHSARFKGASEAPFCMECTIFLATDHAHYHLMIMINT